MKISFQSSTVKNHTCLMALGFATLCCALNTTPASADVAGSIDKQTIDFPAGKVMANVNYTVTNSNATSCTTILNNKMFFQPTGYQLWDLNDNMNVPAYSIQPKGDHFTTNSSSYPGETYRTDSTLNGLTGFPKFQSTIKTY